MTLPQRLAADLLARHAARLQDFSQDVAPLEIVRVLKEISAAIATTNDREELAALYSLRATALVRQGKHRDALTEFKKAARLAPESADYPSNVAMTYLALEQLEEASTWLQRAQNRPHQARRTQFVIALNLAEVHRRRGDLSAAAAAVRLASLRADHTSPADLYSLATAAAWLGWEDDAVEFLAQTLSARVGMPLGDAEAIVFVHEHGSQLPGLPPNLSEVVNTVRARHIAPLPPEAQFPSALALSPAGWDAFHRALESPPAPSVELRRLFNDRRH